MRTCVLALALSLAGVAGSLAESVWQPFGLEGLEVLDLETDGNYLYATVFQPPGLYRRYLDHPDSSWTFLGFDGWETVWDIWTTVARPGWVYVGNPATGSRPWERSIHRSGDSGLTWEPAMEGIPCGYFCPSVNAIAGSVRNPSLIYAYVGEGWLYSTTNGADSWECCVDELSGFAGVGPLFDPHDADRIWVLAYSGFFWGYLYRSNDLGGTWDVVYDWCSLSALAVDPFTGRVYLVRNCEGQEEVLVSEDGGNTWNEILAFPCPPEGDDCGYTSDLLVAPWNGADVMLGRWPSTDRPVVWLSRDAGQSWNPHENGLPADAAWVFPLRADIRHPGVIYSGVNADSGNRGVWRIQLDDVVVLDAPAEAANVDPGPLRVLVNPASGEATFVAPGTTIGADDRLMILDAAGRIVSTIERSTEESLFRWTGRDAAGRMTPAGTYFAVLDRGGERSAEKFVWLGR